MLVFIFMNTAGKNVPHADETLDHALRAPLCYDLIRTDSNVPRKYPSFNRFGQSEFYSAQNVSRYFDTINVIAAFRVSKGAGTVVEGTLLPQGRRWFT